jgi:hypothetical protein
MTRTPTLLPLDTWRERHQFLPWAFWGFRDDRELSIMESSSCNPILMEYSPQGFGRISREDIRQSLVAAEDKMASFVNTFPAPKFVTSQVLWPRLADSRMIRGAPIGASWDRLGVSMPHYKVQSVGVRALTAISLNQSFTMTDQDSDGYPDLVTIGPIAVPDGVPLTEIALYFSEGDRVGTIIDLDDDRWRIEPIQVTYSGGQMTIRLRPWLLGKPVLYEPLLPQPLDPAIGSSSYVTTVDVYRRYTYTDGQSTDDSQAVIIWETQPTHGWWCCCGCNGTPNFAGSPMDPAAVARAVARAGIKDSESGVVTPAQSVYNATTQTWAAFPFGSCQDPDQVLVRYSAGYPLDKRGHMQSSMVDVMINLSTAELLLPPCGCEASTRSVGYLQRDMDRIGQEQELFQVSDRTLNNLFGTRRGHVLAFQQLQQTPEAWGSVLI